jgi:hypothetical protein
MTPELKEFRKWSAVADLIEEMSEGRLDPVVLNTERIGLLLIHKGKAFFFSSCPEAMIAVEIAKADTGEILDCDWLGSSLMPREITFREIAHYALARMK